MYTVVVQTSAVDELSSREEIVQELKNQLEDKVS